MTIARYSTDATDLWWTAAESGWGVNVVQQEEILFLTFFVYGPDGKAIWYVAPATAYVGPSVTQGLLYVGPLYLSNGAYFGGPYSLNTTTAVGTVTFSLENVGSANITYNVGSVTVTKQVTRLTWRNSIVAGNYLGGEIGVYFNCTNANNNGVFEIPSSIGLTHSGSNLTMVSSYTGTTSSCTYTGPYKQEGHMGSFSGTFTCTGGVNGTFTAIEIEASISAVGMRLGSTLAQCSYSGRFGGVRRTN